MIILIRFAPAARCRAQRPWGASAPRKNYLTATWRRPKQATWMRLIASRNQQTRFLIWLREAYASTGGFHDIRGRVVSGLESLATTPMSQQSLPDLASVPLVAEMTNLRTNAAIAETAEYTKRFDSKLAELLPIAEAIQAAVEQANEVSSAVFDSTSQEATGGGNGGFALGGVFRHGRVTAYANGGIPDYVNSPTLAPMALFGEAGPESIMPLRRGPDGRLGVEVNGSDNQAVVSELRAVRDEIVSLREATADSDGNESTGLVEAIAELRVQVGGLREELRTARLRAQ